MSSPPSTFTRFLCCILALLRPSCPSPVVPAVLLESPPRPSWFWETFWTIRMCHPGEAALSQTASVGCKHASTSGQSSGKRRISTSHIPPWRKRGIPCCASLREHVDRLKGRAACLPLVSVVNQRLTFDWGSGPPPPFSPPYQDEIIGSFSQIYPVFNSLHHFKTLHVPSAC